MGTICGVEMTYSAIEVLRLGHRVGRDPRITTHLALVSRAMGADQFTSLEIWTKSCYKISPRLINDLDTELLAVTSKVQ